MRFVFTVIVQHGRVRALFELGYIECRSPHAGASAAAEPVAPGAAAAGGAAGAAPNRFQIESVSVCVHVTFGLAWFGL